MDDVHVVEMLAAAILLLLGGGAGKAQLDRWRNGGAGRDATHITNALHKEGEETRTVLRENNKEIANLRVALAGRCPYLVGLKDETDSP